MLSARTDRVQEMPIRARTLSTPKTEQSLLTDTLVATAPAGRSAAPESWLGRPANSCRGILDEVRRSFQSSGYAPIRALDCQLESGALVIRGRVPSYYLKQVAQELVLRLRLAERVRNAVTVEESGTYVPG